MPTRTVHSRLGGLESQVADLRVGVARVEERLEAHATAAGAAQESTLKTLESIQQQLEGLKANRWRLHGAYAVITAVVSVLARVWR